MARRIYCGILRGPDQEVYELMVRHNSDRDWSSDIRFFVRFGEQWVTVMHLKGNRYNPWTHMVDRVKGYRFEDGVVASEIFDRDHQPYGYLLSITEMRGEEKMPAFLAERPEIAPRIFNEWVRLLFNSYQDILVKEYHMEIKHNVYVGFLASGKQYPWEKDAWTALMKSNLHYHVSICAENTPEGEMGCAVIYKRRRYM